MVTCDSVRSSLGPQASRLQKSLQNASRCSDQALTATPTQARRLTGTARVSPAKSLLNTSRCSDQALTATPTQARHLTGTAGVSPAKSLQNASRCSGSSSYRNPNAGEAPAVPVLFLFRWFLLFALRSFFFLGRDLDFRSIG